MNKANSVSLTTTVHGVKAAVAKQGTRMVSQIKASAVKLMLPSRFIALSKAKTTFKFLRQPT